MGNYHSLYGKIFGVDSDTGVPIANGQRIYPNIGLGQGRYIWCDPANGGAGRSGFSYDTATDDLAEAYALATAGRNDTVVLVGDGATTATARLEENLDWAKNATHLIGITAPASEAQRARISHLTTETANFLMMTVSASGCHFDNFSFFQGVGQASTDENLISITGSRNYFGNVHFGGLGNQVGADRAGSDIIALTGGGENTFERCTIGLETIQRGAANASVRVRSGAQRNRFVDCEFPMAADATSPLWVDANAANALNGSSLIFKRCFFRNLLNVTGAADPAVVATYDAAVNGTIYFIDCVGNATKWAAAGATVQVGNTSSGTLDGFDSGMTQNAADS